MNVSSLIVFVEDPQLPNVMKRGDDSSGNKYNKNVTTLRNVSVLDVETGKQTEEGKKVGEWVSASAKKRSPILERTVTATRDTDKNKIPKVEVAAPKPFKP